MLDSVENYLNLLKEEQLDRSDASFVAAEASFVADVKKYSVDNGIFFETYVLMGVDPQVLRRAGMSSLEEMKETFVSHGRIFAALNEMDREDFKDLGLPDKLLDEANIPDGDKN